MEPAIAFEFHVSPNQNDLRDGMRRPASTGSGMLPVMALAGIRPGAEAANHAFMTSGGPPYDGHVRFRRPSEAPNGRDWLRARFAKRAPPPCAASAQPNHRDGGERRNRRYNCTGRIWFAYNRREAIEVEGVERSK
jgi:hypothetical protein